jgi:hypothetical protein
VSAPREVFTTTIPYALLEFDDDEQVARLTMDREQRTAWVAAMQAALDGLEPIEFDAPGLG